MRQSEAINDLATALAAAQLEMKAAELARTNPHFKSRFAGLPEVWEVTKVLHKHGIALSQDVWTEGEDFAVACCATTLAHKSGQWRESSALKLRATKADAQGVGSALTYARRYSASAVVWIVADDDDDGEAAVKKSSTGNGHKAAPAVVPAASIPKKANGTGSVPVWQQAIVMAADYGFDCGPENKKLWTYGEKLIGKAAAKWTHEDLGILDGALAADFPAPVIPPDPDIPY